MKFNVLTESIGHIIVFWNNPSGMQAMLNLYATGLKSDPYALAQRFPTDSANKTR